MLHVTNFMVAAHMLLKKKLIQKKILKNLKDGLVICISILDYIKLKNLEKVETIEYNFNLSP